MTDVSKRYIFSSLQIFLIFYSVLVATVKTVLEKIKKTRKQPFNHVSNVQGGDLGCLVCLLELPVCLAQRVIWERAVKVSLPASLTKHK